MNFVIVTTRLQMVNQTYIVRICNVLYYFIKIPNRMFWKFKKQYLSSSERLFIRYHDKKPKLKSLLKVLRKTIYHIQCLTKQE